jgi:hypothetical protein
MKTKDYTVLLVPTAAWSTLQETLEMDTQSSSFDSALRKEIRNALDQVKPITAPLATLLDVAEEVPRCARVGSAHVIGEKRMGRLEKALRFFRSPFEMLGGRRQYKKNMVRTTQSASESILREFVADVQAVGVTAVREQFDWPDLVATYEKALKFQRGGTTETTMKGIHER